MEKDQNPMPTPPCQTERPAVLIVDDEPIIARTLALILQQNGFAAVSALSGEAAIETARASHPDALVADVYLRGLDGIETALRVREISPGCKIILISGADLTPAILAEMASLGADCDFLTKPFTPDDLLELLRAQTSHQRVPAELTAGQLVASH